MVNTMQVKLHHIKPPMKPLKKESRFIPLELVKREIMTKNCSQKLPMKHQVKVLKHNRVKSLKRFINILKI